MTKVAIFIDGDDFYHGLVRNEAKRDIDFCKFSRKLCGPTRRLKRTYYYNIEFQKKDGEDNYLRQQEFFKALRIHTKLLKVITKTDPDVVNAQIIVDMLNSARLDNYDIAILVSSNNVFVPAVESIQENYGKQVEHVFFKDGAHQLRQTSDDNQFITNTLIEECTRQNTK